jgi:serine/threonine-protein kinase
MGDAGVELDEAIAAPDRTGDARASSANPVVRPSWARLGAIAVLIAAAAGFAAWTLKPAPSPVRPVTRFTVALPEGQQLAGSTMPNLAVSPDGRRLAYRTPSGIFVRGLDELEPRLVARAPGSGLWFAPDGESLLVGTTSGLSVVPVGGGPMRDVVSSGSLGGAHWTTDGSIVYSTQKSIVRVPAGGGNPQEVVTAAAGEFVAWPQVLPGGTRLLFTRLGGPRGLAVIRSLDDGSEQVVLKGAGGARYVDTGHLVYGQDGRVFAVPINLSTGALGGRPLLVPEVVYVSPQSGWVQAAISETGTMVYLSLGEAVSQSRLVLRDAKGPAVAVPTPPRVYSDIALSPDGRRAAVHLWDEDNDVWVADLVRGGLTRITFTPNEEETPVWSPDGLEVAFVATPPGEPRALFRRPADGGAAAADRKVWEDPDHFHANDWTPDGRTIIVEIRRQTSNDLLAIDVASGKETVLITSPYAVGQARLSRDGRWIAYSSNESGRQEVYVQPFPALDRRVPVSTGGGGEPIWSRDGRRLFFRSPTGFMEATVLSTSPLEFSAPRALFADRYERTQGEMHTHFDVDAQDRFLLIEIPQVDQAASQVAIHVVVNWAESLKMLAMGRQ